jgi:hypothetical protein
MRLRTKRKRSSCIRQDSNPAAWHAARRNGPTIAALRLISRFGLSALCYVGVATMGVIFGRRDFERGLSGLLFVIVVLLVIAVRNTWDLLVAVTDRPDAGPTRRPR